MVRCRRGEIADATDFAKHLGRYVDESAWHFGHKDTTMLLKHYVRWIDGADKGAEAAKLNAAFTANWPRGKFFSMKSMT